MASAKTVALGSVGPRDAAFFLSKGIRYTGDRFRCDYKMFYTHVDPAMKIMAALISQGRIADEIMQLPEMRVSATDDATAGHLAKGSVR